MLREIIKQLCSYKGVEILGGNVMSDHVHILVSIPPKMQCIIVHGIFKRKECADDVRQTRKLKV